MAVENQLTERQAKWFASVRAGLERETGRSLAEWVEIARTCPETGHRARLKWFKDTHGLLQNRASYVLSEAFPPIMGWREPDALLEALWADPAQRALYDAVAAVVETLPDVVAGQRKTFSAWSRKFQFAALRPVKGGAFLGLAVPVTADQKLSPCKNDGWSERLTERLAFSAPEEVDAGVEALLRQAWEGS